MLNRGNRWMRSGLPRNVPPSTSVQPALQLFDMSAWLDVLPRWMGSQMSPPRLRRGCPLTGQQIKTASSSSLSLSLSLARARSLNIYGRCSHRARRFLLQLKTRADACSSVDGQIRNVAHMEAGAESACLCGRVRLKHVCVRFFISMRVTGTSTHSPVDVVPKPRTTVAVVQRAGQTHTSSLSERYHRAQRGARGANRRGKHSAALASWPAIHFSGGFTWLGRATMYYIDTRGQRRRNTVVCSRWLDVEGMGFRAAKEEDSNDAPRAA